MKKSTIVSLIGLSFTLHTHASESLMLDEITVKVNRFERKDTETTYASEIHTAAQIEASGAATLYDYLAQQTSLNASPNIGNKATPAINLRGFGTENGHQNVVITLDGQRLNNIDLSPALLSGIALGNIDRIEIAKGSGSVIYGDGATAGVIQIYTKNNTGITISSALGNYGQKNSYINAGFSEKHLDLSVNLAHDSNDGFSKKDITGHKDQFTSNSQNAKLRIKPSDKLRFDISATSARNDVRYLNPLTPFQFRDDPRQNGGKAYTHQSFDTDQWRIGAEYDIHQHFRVNAFHYEEDKFSEFISESPSTANSRYKGNDFSVNFENDNISLVAGYQNFDGERKSFNDFTVWGLGISKDNTTKKNEAFYLSGEYQLNALTLSAGIRDERVKYKFSPVISADGTPGAKHKENIDAWEIGANYKINPQLSVFANLNQAYQAPDIDRLFTFGGGFNGFINPAKTQTLNVGLNHVTASNRMKITIFRTKLEDEIYVVPIIFKNTNIDKSHKYGLELQNFYRFDDRLNGSVIYNFTRAIIDSENEANGSFNDKNLPGVPKHSLIANLNYRFYDHINLNLNHTWRSKAYAFNDFANTFAYRQDYYRSTNLTISYQHKNVNVFASINNLFNQENSIQVQDNAIYPVDFVRTWRIGMKADF